VSSGAFRGESPAASRVMCTYNETSDTPVRSVQDCIGSEVSLSTKSVMLTLARSINLAPGVFAPGHLGELTQVIPFELVDAVLAETGRTERRLRLIPSRVALYLVLAMALFEQVSAFGVWSKLTATLGALAPSPSEKALRDARRRIGAEPVKALFEVLAGPLAQPHTPGTRYRRWRTVAFDGCSSTKIPETPRNTAVYGPPNSPKDAPATPPSCS
jgi:hypothetical protein